MGARRAPCLGTECGGVEISTWPLCMYMVRFGIRTAHLGVLQDN